MWPNLKKSKFLDHTRKSLILSLIEKRSNREDIDLLDNNFLYKNN